MDAVLTTSGVAAGYYGHAVVEGLDLVVSAGNVVSLLGANGAGKTTALLALGGELPLLHGEVQFADTTGREALHRRARKGLGFVLEERAVFASLSVAENLRVSRCDVSYALKLFPELERLMKRRAGLLSGGEQQMLSLAEALARHPRLLMVDELSLGLAPLVVARLMRAVREAADSGVAVLLVEQHVRQALAIADYAYVMRRGRIVLEGHATDVASRINEVEASYLSLES